MERISKKDIKTQDQSFSITVCMFFLKRFCIGRKQFGKYFMFTKCLRQRRHNRRQKMSCFGIHICFGVFSIIQNIIVFMWYELIRFSSQLLCLYLLNTSDFISFNKPYTLNCTLLKVRTRNFSGITKEILHCQSLIDKLCFPIGTKSLFYLAKNIFYF